MFACVVFLATGMPAASTTPYDTSEVQSPPNRPVPLTADQYAALQDLERQPEHRARRNVPASYAETASPPDISGRLEADLVHHGFQAVAPSILLVVLIAAAPL
jgi:hypothetical protein